jgi:hypothetical protein
MFNRAMGPRRSIPVLRMPSKTARESASRTSQAAVSNYLIPSFGVVIAAIVQHEWLTKSMVAGANLLLASTLLVTVYEEHQRTREPLGVASARRQGPLSSEGGDPTRTRRQPPLPIRS